MDYVVKDFQKGHLFLPMAFFSKLLADRIHDTLGSSVSNDMGTFLQKPIKQVFIPINFVFGLHWSLIHINVQAHSVTHYQPHQHDEGLCIGISKILLSTCPGDWVYNIRTMYRLILVILRMLSILNNTELPPPSALRKTGGTDSFTRNF